MKLEALAAQTHLLPSMAQVRRDRDRAYLMRLTPENLLRSHYLEAGLIRMNNHPTDIHWGWDSPTSDIRGTVCGHWLSAAAHLWRETRDEELLARARFIVREIARCQQANGGRWAFPIPEKYMYRLRDGHGSWAPQYVCHKNMMGLLDMYRFADDQLALKIVLQCADWFDEFTRELSRETMSDMMDAEETGGLMEYWADLYAVTHDEKHLALMRRYERPRLADGLEKGVDMLTNMHANATVPEIQGYARAYEVTGEQRYRDVVEAYWACAVTNRDAFATGGQTCGEVWTPMHELKARLGDRNQEHCVVYNMMRLSEYLLRWTGKSEYADYWEKGLLNGIFAQGFWRGESNEITDSDLHPVTTVSYYLGMQPGAVKRWGHETEHFWCCHCTLLQANAIHHESLYYQADGALMVAQYLPSEVTTMMGERQVKLRLTVDERTGGSMLHDAAINRELLSRPHALSYCLQISMDAPAKFRLALRLPDWLAGEAVLRIGNEVVPYEVQDGFAWVERVWMDECVRVELPKCLRCIALPDDPDMVAFVDGPVCLAGLVSEEHLLYGDPAHPEDSLLCADDERQWQQWKSGWKTYHQPFGIRFKPLYEIGYEPYTIYFPVKPIGQEK